MVTAISSEAEDTLLISAAIASLAHTANARITIINGMDEPRRYQISQTGDEKTIITVQPGRYWHSNTTSLVIWPISNDGTLQKPHQLLRMGDLAAFVGIVDDGGFAESSRRRGGCLPRR